VAVKTYCVTTGLDN